MAACGGPSDSLSTSSHGAMGRGPVSNFLQSAGNLQSFCFKFTVKAECLSLLQNITDDDIDKIQYMCKGKTLLDHE